MRGQPGCLLQSVGGEANRILLASALSSMHIICPNRVSRRDWIIAVSLGCFVSLRTSSFRWNFEIKKKVEFICYYALRALCNIVCGRVTVFSWCLPRCLSRGNMEPSTGPVRPFPGQHGESIPLHMCTCRGIRWLQLVFSSLVCVYIFHILRAWFLSEWFICTRMEQNFVCCTFIF